MKQGLILIDFYTVTKTIKQTYVSPKALIPTERLYHVGLNWRVHANIPRFPRFNAYFTAHENISRWSPVR